MIRNPAADERSTALETLPPQSGVMPVSSRAFGDDMASLQMELTARLVALAAAVEGAPAGTVASYVRAAGRDLVRVRRALASLRLDVRDVNVRPMFAAKGPLADYIRGTYAWCGAVARALEHLAAAELRPAPDLVRAIQRLVGEGRAPTFAQFEREVESARWLRLSEQEPVVRRHWATLRRTGAVPERRESVAQLAMHLDELFLSVGRLGDAVDVRAARRRVDSWRPARAG